jgi:hypothetical protein
MCIVIGAFWTDGQFCGLYDRLVRQRTKPDNPNAGLGDFRHSALNFRLPPGTNFG